MRQGSSAVIRQRKGDRQSEDVQVVEHIRRVHARHYFKAQHAAGALQSLGGESLVTGPRQARVMNGLDQRMREQVPRDGIRILLLPVHAQGQCLDAAAHRIAFSGRQYPSKTVLGEVHAIGQILTGDDHETGVDVGVTGQVLGAEWITTSAPRENGCCRYGVTNVLSTMDSAP